MAEQIVGIDIGGGFLKAVRIEKSFKEGIRVTDTALINIEEAGGLNESLARLFANPVFLQGRCAVNYPGRCLSFRRLRLPFTNRSKIAQTITFEVEPLIPYPIEDVVIDYEVIAGQGYSDIMASIAIRSDLDEWMALFDAHGRSVEILDVEAFSMLSIISKKEADKNILLLDIGQRSAMAIFCHAGRIIQARHFAIGQESFKRESALNAGDDKALNNTIDERNDSGGCIDEPSGEWKILLAELKKTGDYLAWHGNLQGGLAKIFLAGGGSMDEEVQGILSKYFAVAVAPADMASQIPAVMDEELRKTWSPALMDQALALAVRLARREGGFNFKPLVRVRKNIIAGVKNNIKYIAAIAIAFLTLAGVEFYLDYSLKSVMASRLKDEANAIFLRSAPDATRIVDAVQQMKTRIAEAKKATSGIKEATSGVTVLQMLRDISSLAPPAAGFAIASFSYDGSQIIIKGDALNFDAVETIKRELGLSKHFSGVTISASNIRKQDNKVEFELRIGVKKQA